MDIFILLLLMLQLTLGLFTIPMSLQHLDGENMVRFMAWAQRIVTLRSGAAELVADAGWLFKTHIVLGLTVFLVFPFGRLVHVWSAPVWYVARPYQIVRSRRFAHGRRSAIEPG
jgi:nitrate reductase gamma subunit